MYHSPRIPNSGEKERTDRGWERFRSVGETYARLLGLNERERILRTMISTVDGRVVKRRLERKNLALTACLTIGKI